MMAGPMAGSEGGVMKQAHFDGRILVLGFGGVARCTLPLLLKHLDVPRDRVTVLDMADISDAEANRENAGVRFVRARITRRNLATELSKHVSAGDLLVDLAWNISCVELLEFCRERGVLYVNTSVELWDPYAGAESVPPVERTLYVRQMEIRDLISRWGDNGGPTAVLDHGANPGLVSHFTKLGLRDLAMALVEREVETGRRSELERALADNAWNRLAALAGVKVIHISELDTQFARTARRGGEFLNTWSVEGFYEESIAPAEMGWGTHERSLPFDGHVHTTGPRNQICLSRFGMNTFVRSRVPSGEITGMVIRHGEAFSISEFLTLPGDDGSVAYRPTVHYAYCPCEAALESIAELRENGYPPPSDWRILRDEIAGGKDELGVLLMGHDLKSWWTGTVLGIDEARKLVPGQNATTLQVAASVVGAVLWMLRNPRQGVRLPDELPWTEILDFARPYLGRVVSKAIDWMPTARGTDRRRVPASDSSNWQFEAFAVGHPPQPRCGRDAGLPIFPQDAIPEDGTTVLVDAR
jgi:homospermidine synthase